MTSNYRVLAEDVLSFLDSTMNVGDYKNNFPPTNIYKKDSGDMVFEFAVAGYDPENIHIKFSGDKLEVKSDASDDNEEEKGVEFFKRKIAKRSFYLQYSLLAGHFDTAKTKASYKNGILQIEIPASENVKPRDVQIDIVQ